MMKMLYKQLGGKVWTLVEPSELKIWELIRSLRRSAKWEYRKGMRRWR